MGASLPGGGGRRGRNSRYGSGGFTEINVTPFVDVMLVLLIVFMVAAPMMTSGVQVDLPKAQATPVAGTDEPLNVTIRRDGSIFIQNTQVTLEELGPKLQSVLGEKKETRIFVRGDTSIDYGNVMKAIGTINAAGFTKVALLTDQPATAPRR
ncbi:MAG: protein TolR [Rickettsiales bacterium]